MRLRLTCCAFLLTLTATAQNKPEYTFKADVNLVQADVQVLDDGTGAPIPGLDKDDFLVFEDGNQRPIAVFERGAVPLDIACVFDVSMHPTRGYNHYSEAFNAVVTQIKPGDRVAVLSFSNKPSVKTELTGDRNKVADAFYAAMHDKWTSRGNVHIYDAVIAGADVLRSGPKANEIRRRVVMLVTHNREEPSQDKEKSAAEALWEADAPLETIVVPQIHLSPVTVFGTGGPWGKRERRNGEGESVLPDLHTVDKVAQDTGGEVLGLSDSTQQVWQKAIDDVRSRYLFGFYGTPSEHRTFRTIRIQLSPTAKSKYPKAVIYARRGYHTRPQSVASSRP